MFVCTCIAIPKSVFIAIQIIISLLQIASTKLYCYHSVIINVIEINRNQLLIDLQKYGAVSLIYCIDKNTKFTGLNILLYG